MTATNPGAQDHGRSRAYYQFVRSPLAIGADRINFKNTRG